MQVSKNERAFLRWWRKKYGRDVAEAWDRQDQARLRALAKIMERAWNAEVERVQGRALGEPA